jgi:MYXO-CTERM domain-containing protein
MKQSLAALTLAAGTLLAAVPASAAIVVSFVPDATNIAIGGVATVEMRIAGLDSEILSAFDINMLFDQSVLDNFSVTHNVVTEFGGFPANSYVDTTFDPGDTGVIDGSYLDDVTLAASQADAFTVLTFRFTGLADGFSFINLGLDPDFQRNFVGSNFQTLTVDVQGTCVSVGSGSCSVPEPATFGLAALGLLGAFVPGALRRRREKH